MDMRQLFCTVSQAKLSTGIQFCENYGAHGTTQVIIYPGLGNVVDGYLIYVVPASLKPENTYVEIVFDGQDRAIWKLA
ncbi:MAG: hypothetical protein M0Q92_10995 [Methanoregula sp.]|jgi:hypothetical protein|nr:hypothetical protein [Methanoregula sp.]